MPSRRNDYIKERQLERKHVHARRNGKRAVPVFKDCRMKSKAVRKGRKCSKLQAAPHIKLNKDSKHIGPVSPSVSFGKTAYVRIRRLSIDEVSTLRQCFVKMTSLPSLSDLSKKNFANSEDSVKTNSRESFDEKMENIDETCVKKYNTRERKITNYANLLSPECDKHGVGVKMATCICKGNKQLIIFHFIIVFHILQFHYRSSVSSFIVLLGSILDSPFPFSSRLLLGIFLIFPSFQDMYCILVLMMLVKFVGHNSESLTSLIRIPHSLLQDFFSCVYLVVIAF